MMSDTREEIDFRFCVFVRSWGRKNEDSDRMEIFPATCVVWFGSLRLQGHPACRVR